MDFFNSYVSRCSGQVMSLNWQFGLQAFEPSQLLIAVWFNLFSFVWLVLFQRLEQIVKARALITTTIMSV